jgi:hypothetical protein
VILVCCCQSAEVTFHYVHIRFMVMINYGYLVVENDDTKKWLNELPCMLTIGC